MWSTFYVELITIAVLAGYVLAITAAVDAILTARTSQGAVAWVVSLLSLPYLAVPLYWVFGRNKFAGYYEQREQLENENRSLVRHAGKQFTDYLIQPAREQQMYTALLALARIPATRGNRVELLVNGQQTFDSLAAGLTRARHYILFEFYIIRDDGVGNRLGDILAGKAQAGLKVYLLYDEIGSRGFHRTRLCRRLLQAGVHVAAFNTTQGRRNRFQINFRNHRKIVVVDGLRAWIGGLNVGDEYLGLDPGIGEWRDTHTCVEGPAALGAQLAFATDWRWATRSALAIDWRLDAGRAGDCDVFVFPSDPSSDYDEAGLMFHQAIVEARQRIWIASPYFVPDQSIVAALQLASLRGVDVRVIIPDQPDGPVVGMAAWSYSKQLLATGVKIYRYRGGFLHQKVLLMDDMLAGVGTANFDNRSFRLNFESTLLVNNREFAGEVEEMLHADLQRSRQVSLLEINNKPFWFPLAMGAARLMSPVL
jgi:cardiolipin synthase